MTDIVAYTVHYGEKLGAFAALIAMPTLGTAGTGEIKMRRTLTPRAGAVPAEIVLCHLPHNNVTPLATWQNNTAEFEGCYWGHYFQADEAEEAIADFMKRGR